MTTYNLRRFSRPDVVKAIAPNCLLQLLAPYRDFFAARGLRLPASGFLKVRSPKPPGTACLTDPAMRGR